MEIQNPKNPKEHAKTSKKMQEYAKICTKYHSKQSTGDIDTPKVGRKAQTICKHKMYNMPGQRKLLAS
jgi:hypothetical protein